MFIVKVLGICRIIATFTDSLFVTDEGKGMKINSF